MNERADWVDRDLPSLVDTTKHAALLRMPRPVRRRRRRARRRQRPLRSAPTGANVGRASAPPAMVIGAASGVQLSTMKRAT